MENTNLLHLQRIRFTVDVEVLVLDHPQAMIDSSIIDSSYTFWMKESPENAKEWLEFQQRLLHAVVSTPDVINKMIVDEAARTAATYFEEEYTYGKSDDIPLEQFLSPAIDTLSDEDRKRIDEFITHDVLADNTTIALYDPFKAKVVNTAIETLE